MMKRTGSANEEDRQTWACQLACDIVYVGLLIVYYHKTVIVMAEA